MRALLIDDDPISLKALQRYLADPLGYEVTALDSCERAWALFQREAVPLVITDIRMTGMTGLELLKRIKESPAGAACDVVLVTGFGDLGTCIEALRAGAADYLLKPISIRQLDVILTRIRAGRALQEEHARLLKSLGDPAGRIAALPADEDPDSRILADLLPGQEVGFFSPVMRHLAELCRKLAEQRAIPVLIEGETGTGKEVIARLIHGGTGPFVSLNCSAIAPTLFESELFGHEEGAFTGARRQGAKGKLELAQGGTLFLDEIGELPLDLQPKLLRVIQERELYRVGGQKPVALDVRFICATNRSLQEMTGQGRFRSDLYYRLNTGYIHLPPLRERRGEIFPLARLFLGLASERGGKSFRAISRDAVTRLEEYAWPGNIRELKSVIDRVALLHDEPVLHSGHLEALAVPGEDSGEDGRLVIPLPEGGLPLRDIQERIARAVLERHGGNVTRAAQYLDVAWGTLTRMARLDKRRERSVS